MTTSDETQRIESETKRLLDEVLGDAIHQSRSAKSLEISQRRRWFAIGLMLLAPFCIAAAAFFWIQSDHTASGIWLCFSIVLLLIGGWHFDKASKEAIAAYTVGTSNPPTKPVRGTAPRRVQ